MIPGYAKDIVTNAMAIKLVDNVQEDKYMHLLVPISSFLLIFSFLYLNCGTYLSSFYKISNYLPRAIQLHEIISLKKIKIDK